MSNFAYDPKNFDRFGAGMVTVEEADKISDEACTYAQNIDLSSAGAIGPRLGKTLFGTETTGVGEILGAAVAVRRDGTQIPLRVRDTILEWYHATSLSWNTLVTGLTDNVQYSFANYVTSTYDRIYIGNGVDTTISWNTATTQLTSAVVAADATINVTSTTGFAASGSIIIAGDTISYSGKTSTTFTGASGALDHVTALGVAQVTSTVSAIEKGTIMMVKDWRLSIAGTPTKEPVMTLSKANSPEDFTESSPRVVGDGDIEDFPEGGGGITSLAERDKWWIIFKKNTIRVFSLDISTAASGDLEIPTTKAVVTAPNIGAVNHYGTTGADNDIFYVSPTGGVRSLSQVLDSTGVVSSIKVNDITDVIRPTLVDYDFTKAASVFFDKKVLVSCKSSSDLTFNDTVVVYDLRTKGIVLYKGWSVACWFIYNNDLYFGSMSDPNTYKAFDSYSDYEGATTETPIDVVWRSKRFNFGHFSKEKEVDLIYVEGLIATGTDIDVTIRYDEDGSRASIEKTIEGDGSYVTQTPVNALGINELGTEPLAGTISAVSDLNKFRVYLTLPTDSAAFNMDIQFGCTTVGGRWKITNYAINPQTRAEPPAHLKL